MGGLREHTGALFPRNDGEKTQLLIKDDGGLFSGMLSFKILFQQNAHCLHSIYLFNYQKVDVGVA